jgi:molybdate transport system substrate-binding protein
MFNRPDHRSTNAKPVSVYLKSAIIATVLMIVACGSARATDEINIAAASDLQFVMKEIAARYETQTGRAVKLSFGSSGNFFAQIQNGAPFDLFFSADADYPRKLEAAGQAEPGTFYQYATGRIVLWVPNGSGIKLDQGMNALLDPAIKKIAIANPAHAPYGRAAEAAMKAAGVYDKVAGKLVLGENISQTAQFVQSGNADVAVLALSLALADSLKGKGRYFVVPQGLYPPLHQAAVVLKASPRKHSARKFLEYLKSPETVALLKQYGFE